MNAVKGKEAVIPGKENATREASATKDPNGAPPRMEKEGSIVSKSGRVVR